MADFDEDLIRQAIVAQGGNPGVVPQGWQVYPHSGVPLADDPALAENMMSVEAQDGPMSVSPVNVAIEPPPPAPGYLQYQPPVDAGETQSFDPSSMQSYDPYHGQLMSPPPAEAAPSGAQQSMTADERLAALLAQGRPRPSGGGGAMQNYLKGFDAEAAILGRSADERNALGAEQEALYARAQEDAGREAERSRMMFDAHKESVSAVQSRMRNIADEIENYEPRDRRTTQQKMGGIIAVALSGIADAIAMGGGNQSPGHMQRANQMIDVAIDRDLQQQRDMLNNKKTALAALQTEYGMAREMLGDEMSATKMAQAMKVAQFEHALGALKSRGGTQEALAEMELMQNGLRMKKQKLLMDLANAQYKAQMASRMTPEKELEYRKRVADIQKTQAETAKLQREGTGAQLSPAERAKLHEQLAANDEALNTIKRTRELRESTWSVTRALPEWAPFTNKPAALNALGAQLRFRVKSSENLGALDKGAWEASGLVTGDPATMGGDADAKMDEFEQTVLRRQAQIRERLGEAPEGTRLFDLTHGGGKKGAVR